MDCPIEYTRYEEPAPTPFLNIPFYMDLDSIISKSTYCFENMESLNLFRKHKNSGKRQKFNFDYLRLVNNKIHGLPLYECKFKKDKSYLLNDSQKNLKIVKYIALGPSQDPREDYEYLGFNERLNVMIFRYNYTSIINKCPPFSIESQRVYSNNLSDGSLMSMVFNTSDKGKSIEVNVGKENMIWKHDKYNKNECILLSKEGNEAGFVDTTVNLKVDKEILGILKINDFYNFSDQDMLNQHGLCNLENEKVIISCFILLLQKRYDVSSKVGTIKGLN